MCANETLVCGSLPVQVLSASRPEWAYDWSLRVPTPVVLWRLTFGPVSAFPVCSLCRGAVAALPLT